HLLIQKPGGICPQSPVTSTPATDGCGRIHTVDEREAKPLHRYARRRSNRPASETVHCLPGNIRPRTTAPDFHFSRVPPLSHWRCGRSDRQVFYKNMSEQLPGKMSEAL